MSDFDEASVRHCLRTHRVHADAEWPTWIGCTDQPTISLSQSAISAFRARALLAECDTWPREKFFEAWAEHLPSGFPAPEEAHLLGLAVMLKASTNEEPVLRSLPVLSLPLTAKERFATLFAVKRDWQLEELTPYVKSLLQPGSSITKLVLQHARSVYANDGSVSYVPR